MTSIAEQEDDDEFSDTEESQGADSDRSHHLVQASSNALLNRQNTSDKRISSHVSISEDFSMKKEGNSSNSTPDLKNAKSKHSRGVVDSPMATTEKGDLSKTLSFDKDEDSSSTVSFDSDGLPVQKSKDHNNYSEDFADVSIKSSDKSSNNSSSNNKDFTGSKAYQNMYRESAMSPVDEDLDDDSHLDDLLGESIGLKKKAGRYVKPDRCCFSGI